MEIIDGTEPQTNIFSRSGAHVTFFFDSGGFFQFSVKYKYCTKFSENFVEHFKPLSAWNCWVLISVELPKNSPRKKYLKKSTRRVYFTILPVSPLAAEFYEIWHTRSSHRHNHVCQIFSQSVQGLRSSDIPKMAISHWLAHLLRRPYNSVPCDTMIILWLT